LLQEIQINPENKQDSSACQSNRDTWTPIPYAQCEYTDENYDTMPVKENGIIKEESNYKHKQSRRYHEQMYEKKNNLRHHEISF